MARSDIPKNTNAHTHSTHTQFNLMAKGTKFLIFNIKVNKLLPGNLLSLDRPCATQIGSSSSWVEQSKKKTEKRRGAKSMKIKCLGGRIWPARRLLANYEGFEAPRSGP